jgi:hypothetical protein
MYACVRAKRENGEDQRGLRQQFRSVCCCRYRAVTFDVSIVRGIVKLRVNQLINEATKDTGIVLFS